MQRVLVCWVLAINWNKNDSAHIRTPNWDGIQRRQMSHNNNSNSYNTKLSTIQLRTTAKKTNIFYDDLLMTSGISLLAISDNLCERGKAQLNIQLYFNFRPSHHFKQIGCWDFFRSSSSPFSRHEMAFTGQWLRRSAVVHSRNLTTKPAKEKESIKFISLSAHDAAVVRRHESYRITVQHSNVS